MPSFGGVSSRSSSSSLQDGRDVPLRRRGKWLRRANRVGVEVSVWVVDASVTLKWLLADPGREADTEAATALFAKIADGDYRVLMPPHWLAEVGSVLARLAPGGAEENVLLLRAMEWPVADGPEVWARAVRMAIDLQQHVFDTLYHAVALAQGNATLVTADMRYLESAASLGNITSLKAWRSMH